MAWRVLNDRRGGAIALLVVLGVGAGITGRRRARRRRRTPFGVAQPALATASRSSGEVTGSPVSEFDRVEQERPAWPEPDDALPAEVPVEAPEADYLEQAHELPIDDEDDRAD